jgi:hypothetical protein
MDYGHEDENFLVRFRKMFDVNGYIYFHSVFQEIAFVFPHGSQRLTQEIALKLELEYLWQFQTPANSSSDKIVPSYNFTDQSLLMAYGLHLTTASSPACFQVHPKGSCTAFEVQIVTKWAEKDNGTSTNAQFKDHNQFKKEKSIPVLFKKLR